MNVLNRPVLICSAQYAAQLDTGQMTMLDVIDRAAQLGASGIELRRESWPNYEFELRGARERLEAHGLIVTFASFNPLLAADDVGRQRLIDDLDLVSGLGASLLRIFPGEVAAASDATWEQARNFVVYAAERGITIALENYSAAPGATLAEIQTVLDRIASSALGTNVDIGNYAQQGQDVVAAIHALGARIIYAHLKDLTGQPDDPTTALGSGTLPMRAIMTELDALPQPITYCFEFAGGANPDERITSSFQFLGYPHARR